MEKPTIIKDKETIEYKPTDKEILVVEKVFSKFRDARDSRDRSFEYFDGLNLVDYIDDSVRRFNTNIDERDDIEDWQARVHDPFTRNKVLAILGKIFTYLPIASFTSRGDEDVRKGAILTNLYEYIEEQDDYEELMVHILLESIVKGTSIGYEGVERKEIKRRDVMGVNDDITIEEKTDTVTRLFGSIVPLEEFYPSNVGTRSIKKMPHCFWRSELSYSKFLMDWGMYDKTKNVQPYKTFDSKGYRPYYLDYITDSTNEGNVEIVRYYNKEEDEYVVLANGVWLNPIKVSGNTEEISPLPFNHKELPFWEIKFDMFGDFFYGKSLPDRLKSLQDVLNVLTNMLLDQSFLTIFKPILVAGTDGIEDDYLRPGRRITVDTQGLPLNQAYQQLDMSTPGNWHQYILEYTRKIMEETSLDKTSSGQTGVGGRTTAQEIRIAADGVAAMLGIFAKMVNYGIKRKAFLKGANILQFMSDPKYPLVQGVLSDGGAEEVNKAFNIFKVDNTSLTGGKRGTKIIEIYGSKEDMPTKSNLKMRAQLSKVSTGKNIEITAIPADYIRNYMFDIKLTSNPKNESSKELEKALQLEKTRVYMSFFPEMINKKELAAQLAEKMGDDPTKVLNDEVFDIQSKTAETKSPMSLNPQENNAQNMVSGAMGGNVAANDMNVINNLNG